MKGNVQNTIRTLLGLDRYIAYMSADELHTLEAAIANGITPTFAPSVLQQWEQQRADREKAINERFENAYQKQRQCKRQTVKR